MIDFHNHLLPAVDDGAVDIDEARRAVAAMTSQGVQTVVVSPHLNAMETERPQSLAQRLEELDAAFALLEGAVEQDFPALRLERGVELMLDFPKPDLSDPRLRLAGTSFVLTEFPGLIIPPHDVEALRDLCGLGWRPIVAHPERYRNLDDLETVAEWRGIGCHVQVNIGSLLGRYGERPERIALALLANGWVDYLCTDYHARGQPGIAEVRERLERAGGEEQATLLLEQNGRRLLADEEPLAVPSIELRKPLWQRLLGFGG